MSLDERDATQPLLAGEDKSGPSIQRSFSRIDPGRLIVVEPFILLYLAAGFPLESIYSQYIYRKIGREMGIDVDNLTSSENSSTSCDIDMNDTNYLLREEVQSVTSQWTLYITLAGFLPSVIAYIFYGSVSDRLGRKLCFILPPIGTLLRALLQTAIIYFDLPSWAFFFNNIEYFFGGASLMIIGCFAYIADTTTQKYLAIRMTMLDVIILVTGGAADLGVGYWIRASGYLWPMIFVVAGKVSALIYAIFFIPETIADAKKENVKLHISDITRPFSLFIKDDGSNRRWKINLLFASFICGSLITTLSLFTLVEMNAPLCWDSVLIGIFGAVNFATKGIGGLMGSVMKKCLAEEWIIMLSYLSNTLEMIYIPFVANTTMMFFAEGIGLINFLSLPMTRTILSSFVGIQEQGALFAAMTTMGKVCEMVGQIVTNNIYSATILFLQGRVVFIIAGIFSFISAVIVIIFTLKTKDDRLRRLAKEKRVQVSSTADAAFVENYGSVNS